MDMGRYSCNSSSLVAALFRFLGPGVSVKLLAVGWLSGGGTTDVQVCPNGALYIVGPECLSWGMAGA